MEALSGVGGRPERAIERGHHTVALERVLVAQKSDPFDIATSRRKVVVVTHLWLEVNLPRPIQLWAECIPNLR